MDTNTYPPIPTRDIPMPILERTPEAGSEAGAMPRVLLQVAGSSHAAWEVSVLSGIFLLLSLLELVLLLRLPPQDPVVVYVDFPRTTLLESSR
jgi:hypothetical protein